MSSFIYIDGSYDFLGGWAFVEFYFILTGYYTTSHFVKKMEKHKVEYDEMFFYVKSKIKNCILMQ